MGGEKFFGFLVVLVLASYCVIDLSPSEPVWQVSCDNRTVSSCQMTYNAKLADYSKLRISIARIVDDPMMSLSARNGSCRDQPWTFQVDSHARESFPPIGVGALGSLVEPYIAETLIRQMETGEKAVVRVSRPPKCETEEVVVHLRTFPAAQEQFRKIRQVLADGKIEPGEWD